MSNILICLNLNTMKHCNLCKKIWPLPNTCVTYHHTNHFSQPPVAKQRWYSNAVSFGWPAVIDHQPLSQHRGLSRQTPRPEHWYNLGSVRFIKMLFKHVLLYYILLHYYNMYTLFAKYFISKSELWNQAVLEKHSLLEYE